MASLTRITHLPEAQEGYSANMVSETALGEKSTVADADSQGYVARAKFDPASEVGPATNEEGKTVYEFSELISDRTAFSNHPTSFSLVSGDKQDEWLFKDGSVTVSKFTLQGLDKVYVKDIDRDGDLDLLFVGAKGYVAIFNKETERAVFSDTGLPFDTRWDAALHLMPGIQVDLFRVESFFNASYSRENWDATLDALRLMQYSEDFVRYYATQLINDPKVPEFVKQGANEALRAYVQYAAQHPEAKKKS